MTETARPLGPRLHGSARWSHLMRRATAMEAAGWRAMGLTIARRPVAPDGTTAHSWDQPLRAVLVTFLVVSALEVVIVDIITARWPWVRFPLLVLGVWGVLFMVGMLLANRTRPHLVGPDGLVVRAGSDLEVVLPWNRIEAVERRRRTVAEAPTAGLVGEPGAEALVLPVQDSTQIDIDLAEPLTVDLPQASITITSVRLAVDDPTAFLSAVRAVVEDWTGSEQAPRS